MSNTPTVSSAGSRQNWSGLTFRGYRFALALSPDEIDQIHRLVYRTFVIEVKQHADPGGERLIDKFHHKNRYLVAKRASEVRGMVAVHDQQPFSVADAIATPGVRTGAASPGSPAIGGRTPAAPSVAIRRPHVGRL